MPLRLTITSYHKLTPGQRAEFELDRGELKIGRNPENDWILPDPERLVSGQHCVIQLRDGTYYLTDTSTNGVQLVNAGVRMHRGNSEPLRDGELLRVGEYDILVQINGAPQIANGAPGMSDPFTGFDALIKRQAPGEMPGAAAAPPARVQIHAGGSPLDTKPDLFDFLASPAVPPPALADHVPPERHDFRPPEPQRPSAPAASETGAAPAIPADWDPFTELGAGPAPVAPATVQATAQAQPQPLPAASENIAGSAPEPAVQRAAVAPPAPASGGDKEEVLEAFLRGAGLEPLRIDRGETLAQMEAIGRSYRHMVEGLIEVLRARASLKGEFRMAQTMIRPVENNPLKFAPNVDEALLLLLRSGNQAFMPADQAIKESFDDLKAHQLAVMAGVQASIQHLLKRFQPAVLEARLSQPSAIGALLPGRRQAQYWELFTELYASISREAEDDFEDLFGREFSRAYEEQNTKLRKG
ncbi:type VI secretion system-associated FHA domain protein TagH [Pseudomonas sp. 09C 129]|uniref:type VI secretion system-associated FHA domain protein TagH n=1 Tax=Pseudomonas sp. 09C 129 TaxID=2054915 RepID=UPI000C6DB73D|nr:type VI secretion system-associated FHA domain protein TagH [Pseudomonas sp. 09C 129]AUG02795.1 type VI secretion system-associated FHA domain protein TagH [Pseudomonas sp. 09C 129]